MSDGTRWGYVNVHEPAADEKREWSEDPQVFPKYFPLISPSPSTGNLGQLCFDIKGRRYPLRENDRLGRNGRE